MIRSFTHSCFAAVQHNAGTNLSEARPSGRQRHHLDCDFRKPLKPAPASPVTPAPSLGRGAASGALQAGSDTASGGRRRPKHRIRSQLVPWLPAGFLGDTRIYEQDAARIDHELRGCRTTPSGRTTTRRRSISRRWSTGSSTTKDARNWASLRLQSRRRPRSSPYNRCRPAIGSKPRGVSNR